MEEEVKEEVQQPIEQLALQLGVPAWAFAAAKVVNKWGAGRLLTVEAFTKGIEAAKNQKIKP